MKVYLADASINDLPIKIKELHFTKKFVAAHNDDKHMTMDNWYSSTNCNPNSDLLLQMDIEGAEYLSLANLSDTLLKRFRIIVMEFHNLDNLWDESFFQIASTSFIKLLQNHTCVHIHPNNTSPVVKINGIEIAPTLEMTFYRNDRINNK